MICHKSDLDSKEKVITALKAGKVVIIPTDTVYGFSALADNSNTDDLIRKIKGRSETKPFIQLISNPAELSKFSDDKIPEKVLNFWPGPLTVIVNDLRLQNQKISTTAFRCPGDKWLREILSDCDYPIYSTSVNLSGHPVLETEEDIVSVFGDKVDLIVLDGDKKDAKPSTIVKINDGEVQVLREGAVKIV